MYFKFIIRFNIKPKDIFVLLLYLKQLNLF